LTGSAAQFRPDFLLLCLRVPKSGSLSLGTALGSALVGRRNFYLPNTLDLDGRLSSFQHLRFRRSQIRNLISNYRTPSLGRVFRHIERQAFGGDLLSGGHIDFGSVRNYLTREVRIVTMLRNPYDRCRSEYFYARQKHLRKSPLERIDSSSIPRIAAKFDFESYVDFLLEHRRIYGDIAAAYLGIGESADIDSFFARHVFFAGVLERNEEFARGLGDRLGIRVQFPHLNGSGSARHVTLLAATRRKLDDLYARDFAIYEYLLEKSREQVASRIRVRFRA
jgi:hypothetical protein